MIVPDENPDVTDADPDVDCPPASNMKVTDTADDKQLRAAHLITIWSVYGATIDKAIVCSGEL